MTNFEPKTQQEKDVWAILFALLLIVAGCVGVWRLYFA